MELLTFDNFGITVSVLSLAFGIWQYFKKREIKRLISLEAVGLHKNISLALGAAQAAHNDVKTNTDPSYEVGRMIGFCDATLHESAKLYCNLSHPTLDDIDDLIQNRQLNKDYIHIYYAFALPRKGKLGMLIKKMKDWLN